LVEIVCIVEVEDALNVEQMFHNTTPSLYGNEWYPENTVTSMLKHLNENSAVEVSEADIKSRLTTSTTTRTLMDCVKELKDNNYENIDIIEAKYPFLQAAITYLGYDKIEAMQYDTTKIKRAVVPYMYKSQSTSIKAMLDSYNLSVGTFITNERCKEIVGEIYISLSLNKVPKATDISEYYGVKPSQKRIKNAKINGLVILKK
jgi:hypothetical protein